MKTGMLWFDNSTDNLADKIQRAAEYYQKKYGQRPTECYVHPTMLKDKPGYIQKIWGIEMHVSRHVLPNHLWIGVEKKL